MSLEMGPQMLLAAQAYPELLEVDWDETMQGLDLDFVNSFQMVVDGAVINLHRPSGMDWLTITRSINGLVKVADAGAGTLELSVPDACNHICNLLRAEQALKS